MKINRDNWQRDFENELDKAERRQLSKVKRYYKTEYKKGVESFVSEGQTNFQLLFSESDLSKIYRDLYTDIGLQFAKWYAKNFDKYIKKGINPGEFVDQWINSFASFGSAVGAQRVTLVSGTAKQTLIKITQRLMSDPEFMTLGASEKARILNNQFDTYSRYQSTRLVRTEATAAANFATMESATTIFPGAQMMKEWIASFDDRTRDTHAEAGGSDPIPYNDSFMVGGSFLMYPGDPSGPSAEVINCRCSIAPFPKEAAQTVGEITDINFSLGGGSRTGFGIADVLSTVGSTVVSGVQNSVQRAATTLKQAKQEIKDLFASNGWRLERTQFSGNLTLSQYNNRIEALTKLFEKYRFGASGNFVSEIILRFKSSSRAYGSISYNRFNGGLKKINLGDKTDSYVNRQRNIFTDKFDTRFKSAVDELNTELATTIHEMGHVLSRSNLVSEKEFFEKLTVIRRQYFKEILDYNKNKNYKAYNEIFMGKYSSTNIDEFLAESFTEYILHSNPSKYARLVGELIDQYYKF